MSVGHIMAQLRAAPRDEGPAADAAGADDEPDALAADAGRPSAGSGGACSGDIVSAAPTDSGRRVDKRQAAAAADGGSLPGDRDRERRKSDLKADGKRRRDADGRYGGGIGSKHSRRSQH